LFVAAILSVFAIVAVTASLAALEGEKVVALKVLLAWIVVAVPAYVISVELAIVSVVLKNSRTVAFSLLSVVVAGSFFHSFHSFELHWFHEELGSDLLPEVSSASTPPEVGKVKSHPEVIFHPDQFVGLKVKVRSRKKVLVVSLY